MAYVLHIPPTLQEIWDTLPAAASWALTHAMAPVCDDPIAATEAFGEDDGVVRTVAVPGAIAVLLLNHQLLRVTVLQITAVS